MIHLIPGNPDPDDTPLGSDAEPDMMDGFSGEFVRPLGVPHAGHDSQIPLWLRNWDIVRAEVDDVGFSQFGWALLLDKLQHAYHCHLQRHKVD